jgi:hypothetical protein
MVCITWGSVEICYTYLNRIIQRVFTFWPIRKLNKQDDSPQEGEAKKRKISGEGGILSTPPLSTNDENIYLYEEIRHSFIEVILVSPSIRHQHSCPSSALPPRISRTLLYFLESSVVVVSMKFSGAILVRNTI